MRDSWLPLIMERWLKTTVERLLNSFRIWSQVAEEFLAFILSVGPELTQLIIDLFAEVWIWILFHIVIFDWNEFKIKWQNQIRVDFNIDLASFKTKAGGLLVFISKSSLKRSSASVLLEGSLKYYISLRTVFSVTPLASKVYSSVRAFLLGDSISGLLL